MFDPNAKESNAHAGEGSTSREGLQGPWHLLGQVSGNPPLASQGTGPRKVRQMHKHKHAYVNGI